MCHRDALRPPFAAIGRIGYGCSAAERGPGHDPIQTPPVPIVAHQLVVLRQPRLPQPGEELIALPGAEAIVDGGRGADAARQVVPLDAGAQHI